MVEDAILVLGLGLGRGEELAVVVVADVLLVQAGKVVGAALFGNRVTHVPVGHQLVAVGVRMDEKHDAVVQEAEGLVVGAARHLVRQFAELLGA